MEPGLFLGHSMVPRFCHGIALEDPRHLVFSMEIDRNIGIALELPWHLLGSLELPWRSALALPWFLGFALELSWLKLCQLICIEMKCTKCDLDKAIEEFYKYQKRGKLVRQSECKQCFNDRMNIRTRNIKRTLVEEAGGCCKRCGYNTSMAALVFHHVDPTTKVFGLAGRPSSDMATLRAEAKKCLLLCHNCHSEHHAGLWGP